MNKFIRTFRALSVLARMYIGFGLLCIIIFILGMTNLIVIKSIASKSAAMSDDAFTTQLKSSNLSISVLLIGKNLADMVAVDDKPLLGDAYTGVKKSIKITSEQLTHLFQHASQYKHTKTLSLHLDTIKKNLDEIEALSIDMFTLHETNLTVSSEVREGISNLLLSSSEIKQQISQASRTKASKDIYVSELVTTIINRFSNIEFLVLNLINTDDADKLQKIVETIRFNTNAFTEDIIDLQEEVAQLVDISNLTDVFLDSLVSDQGIIAAYFQNRQLVAKLDTNLLTVSKKVTISEEALSQIRRFGEKNVADANKHLGLTIVYSTTATIIIVIGALILTVVISIFLARMIKKPLKVIMAKLSQMLQGDYSTPIPDQFTGEFSELASSLNLLIQAMRTIITDLTTAAKEMSQVSESNSNGTKVVKERLGDQNVQLSSSAAAITQMESAIAQVSDKMARSLQLTNSVDLDVKRGQEMMTENLSTIVALDLKMGESKNIVDDVSKMAPEITSIIQVIENVASKTNLLALNAAIEAARAGEQGRGFAVVADEVRQLALLTATSTDKIRSMIERLNEATQLASRSMEASYGQLNNCKSIIEKSSSEMNAIRVNISAIKDTSQQISNSMFEQKSTALEISKSVNRINLVADENVVQIVIISDNSKLLNQQMNVLEGIIKRFSLR